MFEEDILYIHREGFQTKIWNQIGNFFINLV
jgi:hypothetical protein